jgi:hypothetical protein
MTNSRTRIITATMLVGTVSISTPASAWGRWGYGGGWSGRHMGWRRLGPPLLLGALWMGRLGSSPLGGRASWLGLWSLGLCRPGRRHGRGELPIRRLWLRLWHIRHGLPRYLWL